MYTRFRIIDRNILSIAGFTILSRLLLVAIAFLSYATSANKNVLELGIDLGYIRDIAAPLSYGDVTWYMEIAQNGYDQKPFSVGEKANWAFYPLWPLVLRTCNYIFSEMLVSGIITSTIIFVFGLIFLYKLIGLDFESGVGRLAAVLILVFPSSHFFLRPGPESLFLFLTVLAFYLARTRRWLLAGLVAGLATLTRLQGVLLIIPLLYIYYRQYKESKIHDWRVLSLLSIPVAQLGFMLHLYSLTGDLFASVHMQGIWDNNLTYPFAAMIGFLAKPVMISYYGWDLTPISFLAALAAVILTVSMIRIRHLPFEYFIYTGLSVFLVIARDNLNGTLRFLSVIFPLFLVLASWLQERKFATELILYSSTALQVFYFISFILLYNWAAT